MTGDVSKQRLRVRTCRPGSIQAQHKQAHFLGSEDLVQHLGETLPHCDDTERLIGLTRRREAEGEEVVGKGWRRELEARGNCDRDFVGAAVRSRWRGTWRVWCRGIKKKTRSLD